jgi:hypothetical protein
MQQNGSTKTAESQYSKGIWRMKASLYRYYRLIYINNIFNILLYESDFGQGILKIWFELLNTNIKY